MYVRKAERLLVPTSTSLLATLDNTFFPFFTSNVALACSLSFSFNLALTLLLFPF